MTISYTIQKFLLPFTFDEQTKNKLYASTKKRTHDQDWFT